MSNKSNDSVGPVTEVTGELTEEMVAQAAERAQENFGLHPDFMSDLKELTQDPELKESIEKLEEALESGRYTSPPKSDFPFLITELTTEYLSKESIAAMANKARMINKYETNPETGEVTVVTRCIFLSTRVRKDLIDDGIKAVSEDLNRLAEHGLIDSCLAPLSSLDLAVMPMEYPTCIVLAYVHVPESKYADAIKMSKCIIDENSDVDKCHSIHSFKKVIPPGHAVHVVRLSFGIPGTAEERLKEHATRMLAILPKGTELVETRACAITDLSLPYEMTFYNPVFTQGCEVRLIEMRAAGMGINGQLAQGTVLLGIDYVQNDGKLMYQ